MSINHSMVWHDLLNRERTKHYTSPKSGDFKKGEGVSDKELRPQRLS